MQTYGTEQLESFKKFIDTVPHADIPAAIYAMDRITGEYEYMMIFNGCDRRQQ